MVSNQFIERSGVEQKYFSIFNDGGGRRSFHLLEQRHLTEHLTRTQHAQGSLLRFDLPGQFHFSGFQNENSLPEISFFKKRFSSVVKAWLHSQHHTTQLAR